MRAARRAHHLDAAEFRERPCQIGVGQLARLRIVVTHQPAQMAPDRSEVRRLDRHAGAHLALHAHRPLPDVRRWGVELVGEDEGGRAGARERLLETQVRPEAFGRLAAPDRERRIAHRIEHRVADVADVIDARARSHDGLRRHRPGNPEAWREIVLVRHISAAAEAPVAHVLDIRGEAERRIAFIGIAGAGADEDRLVRIEPVEIDVHDRIVRVAEGLVVLPAQPVVHRDGGPQPPAVLRRSQS